MIERLKAGNMNAHKTGSAQNIIYKDFSNSAIGASLYQSSADPTNLASLIRNAFIILSDQVSANVQDLLLELNMKENLTTRDILSDEELIALYAEAVDEDLELVDLGLAHYAEILKQEDKLE
jgi:hypothetical protein